MAEHTVKAFDSEISQLRGLIADDDGKVVDAETDRSRFSSAKDVSYVPLRPERVVVFNLFPGVSP